MSPRVWPFRLAATEGLATARTGRWTSALVIVVVAWLCAAPGAVDAMAVDAMVRGERAWISAGAFVYRVEGATTQGASNPVPVGPCERLTRAQGVEAAFAARRDQSPVRLTSAPGGQVSLVHVSPGAVEFLGATNDPRETALVTSELADRIGVEDGSLVQFLTPLGTGNLATTSGVLAVDVVPTAQLGADLEGAVLVPTALDHTADVCFVRTDAAHAEALMTLMPSALAWDGLPATAGPLLFDGQFTVDYATAYQTRALRWAWVGTATLAALLWGLVQWSRRSYIAIYATFGMSAAPRLVMGTTEWVALMTLGGAWGWALGVAGSLALGAETAQALTQVTWHTVLTLLGATALVVVAGLRPTGTLLDQLKDR